MGGPVEPQERPGGGCDRKNILRRARMKERNRLNFKEVKAAAPGVKNSKKWIFF